MTLLFPITSLALLWAVTTAGVICRLHAFQDALPFLLASAFFTAVLSLLVFLELRR